MICASADILEAKSPSRIYDCVNGLMQLEATLLKRTVGATVSQTSSSVLAHRTSTARASSVRDSSAVWSIMASRKFLFPWYRVFVAGARDLALPVFILDLKGASKNLRTEQYGTCSIAFWFVFRAFFFWFAALTCSYSRARHRFLMFIVPIFCIVQPCHSIFFLILVGFFYKRQLHFTE